MTSDTVPGHLLDPDDPLNQSIRDLIGDALDDFLDGQDDHLARIGTELEPLARAARVFLSGGKRLRPGFGLWGFLAVDDQPGDRLGALVRAMASMELLHVSALVHDDVMDEAETRRSLPSAHRQFEALHRADPSASGSAEQFGRSGAILLGDLLLVWSVEMFGHAGLAQVGIRPEHIGLASRLFEQMRSEVTCGQFLDVLAQTGTMTPRLASGAIDFEAFSDQVRRVTDFKSARYTVRHPLQIGAALAGADPHLQDGLATVGSLVGRAFQFRDDLLGVFGDAEVTGKSSGGDIVEGKRTVLVAETLAAADPGQASLVLEVLDQPRTSPEQVDQVRQIMVETGAADRVERAIAEDVQRALEVLAEVEVTDLGRAGLTRLTQLATERSY